MKHVTQDIQAWLSNELSSAQREQLEAHLKVCSTCSAEATAARQLWESLEAATPSQQILAPSIWPAVRQKTLGRDENGAWFFGTGRWLQASLATATVAAGLLFGVLFPGGGNPSVGGQAEALDLSEDQLESLWLGGSSWEGGYTQLESGWWSVGLDEDEAESSTANGVKE